MKAKFIIKKEKIYDMQITALGDNYGTYLGYFNITEEKDRFIITLSLETESLGGDEKIRVPRLLSHAGKKNDDEN